MLRVCPPPLLPSPTRLFLRVGQGSIPYIGERGQIGTGDQPLDLIDRQDAGVEASDDSSDNCNASKPMYRFAIVVT